MINSPHSVPASAVGLNPRNVLAAAWQLFQVSLVKCVPLAVLAVAASAVPGTEATNSGEPSGFLHSREWWGVCIASTVLTLICYGTVLRIQFGMARGQPATLMVAMREAALDVPGALFLICLALLPLLPAALVLASRGSGLLAAFLTLLGCVPMVLASLAWPLGVGMKAAPWAAYRRSLELVRGNWTGVIAIVALVVASILVFALLASIFMAVIMNLAGQGAQTSTVGMGVSRWMMAAVLALPIVFGCAAAVVTCQTLAPQANAASTPQ